MAESSVASESWNERHEGRALPDPDPWLRYCSPLLPEAGTILDVACGLGQNALWVCGRRRSVTGVDVSDVAVARSRKEARRRGRRARFLRQDVTLDGIPPGPWDGILVFHFLERSLFSILAESLQPGGTLLYKTHLAHPCRAPDRRPRREAFLLRPGELLRSFPSLEPVAYEEWAHGGDAFASLAARKT